MIASRSLPIVTQPARDLPPEQIPHHPEPRSWERYIVVFLKYYKLICGIAILGFFVAAAVALTTPKTYRAGAVLRIGTHTPLFPGSAVEDAMRQQTAQENYFVTEVEEIKNLPVADAVLSDPEVEAALSGRQGEGPSLLSIVKSYLNPLQWFSGAEPEAEPSAAATLASAPVYKHSLKKLLGYLSVIGVSQVKMTALVEVTASSSDPHLAALLANAHARHYINVVTNERRKAFEDNVAFLRSKASDLETRISAVEREMTKYAEENSIVSLNEDESINSRQISELNRLLTEATARRITAENTLDQAKSELGQSSTFIDDPTTDAIRQRLAEAEAEYARESSRFTAEYPKMREIRARIGSLQANLKARRKQSLNTVEAKFRAESEVENNLREQLERLQTQQFEQSRVKVKYNQMAREFESLKDLLQTVLRQLQQVDVSVGGVRANVSIVQPAPVPVAPAGPRRLLIIAGGSFVGLLLGIVLAIMLDFFDGSVKTAAEMGEILETPELGIIPSVAKNVPLLAMAGMGDRGPLPPEGGGGEPASPEGLFPYPHALFSATAPRSVAAEAIRTLRVSLRLAAPDEHLRMVMVTSAVEKEGKSTVAANLAISFAADGLKTVLVDADLRKPAQYQLFGLDRKLPGIVDVISGDLGLYDVTVKSRYRNLDILPSGMRMNHSTELLGSRRMADLLAILRVDYDMVIVDTTPVLPVADALTLTQRVDGVVYVVRGNKTPQRLTRQGMIKLRQARAPVLGAVLNDIPLDRADVAFLYRGSYEYNEQDSVRWVSNG